MDQLRPPGDNMPFPAPRRHSTVPTSFQPAPSRPASNSISNGSVETLFNHPSVKIVAFSAGKSAFDRPSPGFEDTPGSLPSSSQFERTIAVGAFQIYRAPGSVAFLRCGSALQPILPKSQCWTLDERSSKFALQIRRPNYWRIEVPVSDDEDTRRAAVLREILDKILQFEKTPCPFERDFTVQLPERPTTPVKKRPWTPPVRTVSMNWPPQPVTPPPEFATRTRFYNPNARRHSDFGVDLSKTRATPETPEANPEANPVDGSAKISTPTRPPSRRLLEAMETPRQQTIPEEVNYEDAKPEFGIKFRSVLEEAEPLTPPLTAIPPELLKKTDEPSSETRVPVESKVHIAEDLEASPKASEIQRTLAVAKKREPIWITKKPSAAARRLQRPARPIARSADPPELTVSHSENGKVTENFEKSTLPETSAEQDSSLIANNAKRSDSKDSTDTEGDVIEGAGQMRVRKTRVAAFASRRAAAAPALRLRTSTPALNLLEETMEESPQPSSPTVKTIRRIPSTILNKTCEMIFGPPAHLISLMLKVAARIAAGEFRGFVFGMGEGGEVLDVRWDWSDEHSDIDESPALEGWDESDFDFGDDARRQAADRMSRGRKTRASFAAADLARPGRVPGKAIEYQDPWATLDDEEEDPSRSWGVD
ncbi:hypothetical protein Daus18300_010137 [Diaporthe australafricana]|uniref:Inheritance of peroxisomes protein 1 n=1 Tax=Diaporthe australafricana TaxID=127596 RepID=A0ABR3WBE7_9PEZI